VVKASALFAISKSETLDGDFYHYVPMVMTIKVPGQGFLASINRFYLLRASAAIFNKRTCKATHFAANKLSD
jgi:hypothetical protein